MAWGWAIAAIATNKTVGNMLAPAVGTEPGDAHSFDHAQELRKISDGSPAWLVGTLAQETAFQTATEYNAGGYPQRLLDKGLQPAQIDFARSKVKVLTGTVAQVEAWLEAFITDSGYERVVNG